MLISRILGLRIAIAALIWASALLAPAAAAQITHNPSAPKNTVGGIERSVLNGPAATNLGAPVAYRYDLEDAGTATPGPTDPNGPAF
jgi:hypothetical protein